MNFLKKIFLPMSVKKIRLCQIEKFRMTKVKNKVSLDTSTNVYTVCI